MLSNVLSSRSKVVFLTVLCRRITTRDGVIKPKPYRSKWGSLLIIPVFGVWASFAYCGMVAAKNVADTLEELEIFVPSDDD